MKFSKIHKNTLALLGAQVYNKFTAAIFFAVAARALGVTNFGKYTLILTFISFFYIFSDWGLSTLTIRNVARTPDETKKYLDHTLILRICLAGISYLVLIILSLCLSYPKEIIILFTIVGISLFSNNMLGAFNAIFSAYEKMYVPAIMGIIFSTIFLILGILSLYFQLGLITLVSIIVFLSFINAILTGWLLRKFLLPIRFFINYNFYKKLLIQATPYAILSALSVIYFRIDTVMLSKLKTLESVGLYNSAYKIVEFLIFLPVCLMGAYFPQMSRQVKFAKSELKSSYFKSTKFLLTIIIPIAVFCTFFSKDIMGILFGKSFIPAAGALKILVWAVVFMYINAPIGNILYNTDRLYRFIPYAILNTSLNIILNFIFIPKWDYIGASLTTLITEITGFFIQIFFVREILFDK